MSKDYSYEMVVVISMSLLVAIFAPWGVNMKVIEECGKLNPSPLGYYQAKENSLGLYECQLNK